MPSSCYDCPFVKIVGTNDYGYFCECGVLNDYETINPLEHSKHPNCPLIEQESSYNSVNSLVESKLKNPKAKSFDILHFVADNAGLSTFEAIEKAYNMGVSEQEQVLDKIRAEILEEKECAYADFERYKVEYLGQDQEDVLDSLPQDDFRYGMERAIEIIGEYKAESEE